MSPQPAPDSVDAQFWAEQAAAERLANRVRLGAIVALAVLQLALLLTSGEEPAVVAISLVLCGIAGAFGVGLAYWLRRGRYRVLISYLSISHDVIAITALALASAAVIGGGAHYAEATKSSFSLVYFLVIATGGLRQSRRIALFAGVASALGYVTLLVAVWMAAPTHLTTSFDKDFDGPYVDPIRIAVVALLMVLAGLVAAAAASRSRNLVLRTVKAQGDAMAERQRRDTLLANFQRYFPERTALELLSSGSAQRGGTRSQVTVLTADIRGFTSISERLDPDRIVDLLNRYFEAMVEVIFSFEGTVMSFVGDGLWAVFGLPEARDGDADRAVAAARQMREKLTELNQGGAFEEVGGLRIGIAVHSGEVLAGTVGSDRRQEYTVIGDTVNTVARLEKANKELHTDLLVSESTVALLKSPDGLRPRGDLPIRGREATLAVYSD